MSLILSDEPCVAAAVYTTNLIVAAPITLNRTRTPSANIRAVVVNSGNANACTGQQGLENARRMAQLTADACNIDSEQVLVMSTGIIGEQLPMEKIAAGVTALVDGLGNDDASLTAAARGIMTTDTVQKVSTREFTANRQGYRITGLAKGAGMIGPRMATMLSVITTDVPLSVAEAQSMLAEVVDESFNCISVEGHESTNDNVVLLSNGHQRAPLTGPLLEQFRGELRDLCIELAQSIPNDGEGATHLIEIEVTECRTRDEARQIARTVADSALVKTAVAGADPNWGRIVSAAGYAGIDFDPAGLELSLNGTLLYRDQTPVGFDAEAVSETIKQNRVTRIHLRIGTGTDAIRFWTSDLTTDYVHINADYHT